MDIENCGLKITMNKFCCEKYLIHFEKQLIGTEKYLFDFEKWLINIEKFIIHFVKKLIDTEKLLIDLEMCFFCCDR